MAGSLDASTVCPVTDLADDASLANLVARTRAELGPIDMLVNSAGYAVWKPLEATPLAEWCSILPPARPQARHAQPGPPPDQLSPARCNR